MKSKTMETESNGIYEESQQKPVETGAADGEGTRELSLTDHLNKRLLDSFLQKLNQSQPDPSVSSASEENDFADDEPKN